MYFSKALESIIEGILTPGVRKIYLKQFFLKVIEVLSTQERAEDLIEQGQLKKLDLGVCK